MIQQPPQGLCLGRILANHRPSQAQELIGIDFLHGSTAARGGERLDVVKIRASDQRILQPYGLTGRAKVNKRAPACVASVGGRPCYADQPLAVRFIAQKHVATFHLLTQITQARCAPDPPSVTHFVRTTTTRAEILIEFPPAPCIDLEDPHLVLEHRRIKIVSYQFTLTVRFSACFKLTDPDTTLP